MDYEVGLLECAARNNPQASRSVQKLPHLIITTIFPAVHVGFHPTVRFYPTIGFQDIVDVQVVGGAVARGTYEVWADQSGFGAGAITIFVKNISPGSLSEALVLSFAVKKVATS